MRFLRGLALLLRAIFRVSAFVGPIASMSFVSKSASTWGLVLSILLTASSIQNCVSMTTWSVIPKKPDHIFTAWYLFFLAGSASLLMLLRLRQENLIAIYGMGWSITPSPRSTFLAKLFSQYIQVVNIKDEFLTVVVLLFLVIVPQILSVLVSGCFGCAREPLWISRSIRFLLLSIVKFLYVIGGMELALALLSSFISLDHDTYSRSSLVLMHLLASVWFMSCGLLIASVYFKFEEICDAVLAKLPGLRLKRLWARMTRFTSPPTHS